MNHWLCFISSQPKFVIVSSQQIMFPFKRIAVIEKHKVSWWKELNGLSYSHFKENNVEEWVYYDGKPKEVLK